MLSPTNLIKLNKEETIEYLRGIKDICLQKHPKAFQIKPQITNLVCIVAQLDNVLIYNRKSEFTQELKDLDVQRGNAINGLRHGFLMNTYHHDTARKAAGQVLLTHINSYGGGIARLNYEAESTVLVNIAEDYETQPKLIEALKTIEMIDWATILKNTNDAFRTKYQERITVESATQKLSFTVLKPRALKVYKTLYKRIKAFIELDETSTFEILTKELTTLAKRYQQIINTRRNNNQEEKDTQDNGIPLN